MGNPVLDLARLSRDEQFELLDNCGKLSGATRRRSP
jgi:hypothetical protein